MEPGAIFLLLVVVVLVAIFVSRPFTAHWRVKVQSSQAISSLLAERERALTALMELDFDNGIGKVPAEEFSVQRAALIQKGSDVLRQLDDIQAAQPTQVEPPVEPKAAAQNAAPLSVEDLEDLIAKRRAIRQQKTAGCCPNCG